MTRHVRTVTTTVLVTAVLGITLAVGLYTFRAQLTEAPIVSPVLARLGWHARMTDDVSLAGMDMDRTDAAPFVRMTDPESTLRTPSRAVVRIDPRRQQLVGVRTAPVERRALTQSIRAVGTVRYDETRLADVNVKVAGWIEELDVDSTGQLIEAGQRLFTLYSPDLLTTQQEYLLALESREQLRESQIAEAHVYADRLVNAARQRLVLWDLPPDAIQALEENREVSRTMPFQAPVGGFVIEKRIVRGQHVSPGMSLYTVADLSAVWVEADLYEAELASVADGLPVSITVDAYPDDELRGRITYIYPYVDEQTRTVRIRIALQNPRGRLKPGMYTNVSLDAPIGESVVVPVNALLDSGAEQHVFVSEGDGYFEPRTVVIGHRLGDVVQILDGLEVGDVVATSATFFIDSESQLRAALEGFGPVPFTAEAREERERLDITFRSDPDPPVSGDNTLDVTVVDADGKPVTDANVSVVFYMAPMPTMNMPAMQTDATLSHRGEGVYRGAGEIRMAGRWGMTVLVSRDGQRLESQTFTIVAR